jgi:hypothetical protein
MNSIFLTPLLPVVNKALKNGTIDKFVVDMQADIQLEDGEEEAIFVLTTEKGVAKIATMAIADRRLTRLINVMPLSDFLTKLISSL